MSTLSALRSVSDLAEAQSGMFTTRQAAERGVERRDLARLWKAGVLERVAHGVYRIAAVPQHRHDEIMAAWMQLAPGTAVDRRTEAEGVVSHATAAVVQGARLLTPFAIDFTVPPGPRRIRPHRDDVRIHRAQLPKADVRQMREGSLAGMLVTAPERTIADLAAARIDLDHLADAFSEMHLHPTRDLRRLLEPHAGDYGFDDGAELLKALDYTARA
jgi:predicted transcriptional regulator of viral defense system